MDSSSGILPSERTLAPSTAASSPSLGANASDALESSRSLTSSDYVLPPIIIDTTPISLQLPLAFTELQHTLYEAKAPPPLSLPPSFSFAQTADSGSGDDEEDEAAPPSISSLLSLIALPPSLPQSPAISSASPSPPPSQKLSPRAVPRCEPPRSNAHCAFPSPPPSPTLPDPSRLPCAIPPVRRGEPPRPVAQRLSHLPARRYLAPAYVRGECLPFAIEEEPELETSGSEYSTESAVALDGERGNSESRSVTSAGRSELAEKRSKRAVKEVSKLKKCMKSLMLFGRGLGLRGRLRL